MLPNTKVFCQTHILFELLKSLTLHRIRINISSYINRFVHISQYPPSLMTRHFQTAIPFQNLQSHWLYDF